jgi:hypothetical protein
MTRYLSLASILFVVIILASYDIKSEVAAKLDLDNPYIADTAMTMAADYPGEYSINQVSQIYNTYGPGRMVLCQ